MRKGLVKETEFLVAWRIFYRWRFNLEPLRDILVQFLL
jgi:hypothetical protein